MEETNGLERYLNRLFDNWKEHRQKNHELKWNENLKAVKNLDGVRKRWKKGEAGTDGEDSEWRSDTFIGITKQKIWTIYAMLLDIVLPGGDLAFSLELSPDDENQLDEEGRAAVDESIERQIDKIKEQLRDRRADREYMKKMLSLGYYGLTYAKYNVRPVKREGFKQVSEAPQFAENPQEYNRFEYFRSFERVPGHSYRSVWNIYRDPEAESIEDVCGIFDKYPVSPYELRNKKGKLGYIDDVIEHVISESDKEQLDDTQSLPPGLRDVSKRKKTIEIREYWGRVPVQWAQEFESDVLGGKAAPDLDVGVDISGSKDDGREVNVMVELANRKAIRFIYTKDHPFKECFWELDLDDTLGSGVADNLSDIQYLLNGLVRAFEDNKKLSANVILAVKKRFFADASQIDHGIRPGTRYDLSTECDDARKAIMPVIIPDVGETLISAIGLAERWKDMVGMVPEILQGFTLPKQQPDTAYELSQLQENAFKYIGQGVRNIDEQLIEPEIWDIYRYNMMYGEDHASKVNATVHAGGHTAFKNKIIVVQKVKELLALVVTSEFLLPEVKIRPHLEKIYRNMDFDPDEFLKSEEEKAQDQESASQAEEMGRLKAMEEFERQKTVEADQKIRQIRAKGEEDLNKEMVKIKAQEDQDEQGFARDMITKGLDMATQKTPQEGANGDRANQHR